MIEKSTKLVAKKQLGQRIKKIRLNLGENLETFGSRFGANRGLVSAWENGRFIPNPERLLTIATLGNMSVDELLYGSFRYNIIMFLTMFEVELKNDKSVPTELHASIIENLKNRYFDSDGKLIDDWVAYDSLEDLIQSFHNYANKLVEMAKKGTLKEETILSSFITNVEKAFSEFLDYYNLSNLKDIDNSETNNSPKDIFNEELKNKVSELTKEYLNKLNEIEYCKLHDEMNNNQ